MSSLTNNQSGANLYTQGFGNRPENVEIPHIDTRAPRVTDINFPIGKRWIDTANTTEYSLMNMGAFAGVVTAKWVLLGSTAGALNTLSDQTNVGVFPTGGNIQLTGTANQIVTTAGASEITWSLDPVLITPGSLEVTGLLTGDAGATLNTAGTDINIASDNDLANVNIGISGSRTVTIGDVGGVNGVVTQVNIGNPYKSSNVTIQGGNSGVTINGGLSGTLALNCGQVGSIVITGTNDGLVAIIGGGGPTTIGNDSNNNPVTIGSTFGTSSLSLNAGSGNITITGFVGFSSTFTTVPSDSNTVTTAFVTTLTANTGAQNTTGADLLCNISFHVAAATAATITLAVGPTSTPTDNTAVTTFSTAALEIINLVAYVPSFYYLLYNTTGTITIDSVTVQSMGI